MQVASRIAAWQIGKKLPYDAEVEYLESNASGFKYIDTGIVQDFLPRFVVDVQSSATGDRKLIGCQGEYTRATALGVISGKWRIGMTQWITEGDCLIRTVIDANCATGDYSLSTGETGVMTTKGVITNHSITLFAAHTDSGISGVFLGKMWSAQVYNGSVLVGDFIPVRKDGIGYMYDRVSGELFGNAGTGAFIIGPDKVSNGGGINV